MYPRIAVAGVLALAASWTISGQQWPSQRFGTIEVTPNSTGLRIKRGTTQWRVDLSQLVRTIDCENPIQQGVSVCPKSPTAPCPLCGPLQYNIFAWDEREQRLYFSITTSTSWGKSHQVFRYHLAARRSERLVNTWAGGISSGAVSPGGRYLAYEKGHHTPPAGGCVAAWELEVVDIWTRNVAKLAVEMPKPEAVWFVDKLVWMSPAKLAVVLIEHDKDCNPIAGAKPSRLEIDVRDPQFAPVPKRLGI